MVGINPQKIVGKWRGGYALDFQVLSSVHLGVDEYGHNRFDTTRSPIGQLLYQLKYKQDASVVPEIVETVSAFIAAKQTKFDLIVPVPASAQRAIPPVATIASGMGEKLGIPVVQCITATRATTQLKDVTDSEQRKAMLEGLYSVDPTHTQKKNVLLFDDLFRSGSTMNAITDVLYQAGGAANVFALTLTRTRSNQ
jgi:competence protein ComFC